MAQKGDAEVEQILQFSILDSLVRPEKMKRNKYYKNSEERKVFNKFYDQLIQEIIVMNEDSEVIKILFQYKVISDAEKKRVEAIADHDCEIKFHEIMKILNTTLKRAIKPPVRLLQILRAFRQFPQLDCVTIRMTSKALMLHFYKYIV